MSMLELLLGGDADNVILSLISDIDSFHFFLYHRHRIVNGEGVGNKEKLSPPKLCIAALSPSAYYLPCSLGPVFFCKNLV